MKPIVKHFLATAAMLLIGAGAAFALFVWSGAYNFAADDPHTAAVHSLLETMRDRSIEARARKVAMPADLGDEKRIVQGAGNYNAMCAGCHLAPGVAETELSRGLYPHPPNISKEAVDPQHAFWVIKHGIKASGMPAWGKSMSDEYIWNMAAFLQVLPKLGEGQYNAMVAHSGGHQHDPGDSHDGDAAHDHDHDAGAHEHDEASDSDKHAESSKSEASGSSHSPEAQGSSPHTHTHTHADGKQHVHATQGAKQ